MFTARVRDGEEHLYALSIAVTELLLSGDQEVSAGKYLGFGGLMYPTIASNANGDNFALKPAFATEHLAFVRAHFILVRGISLDATVMSWRGLDTAHESTPDGKLIWSGRCEFSLPPELFARGTWEYLFPRT